MPPANKIWKQLFIDHFYTLDTTKWTAKDGVAGDGSETFAASQVTASSGVLSITCDSTKKSGCLRSIGKFSFLYGWVEFSAKIPSGVGYWPGLWLLSIHVNTDVQSRYEIDVQEGDGSKPTLMAYNWHWGTSTVQGKNGGTFTAYADLSKDYHVYALNWLPDRYEWYLDGTLVGLTNDYISKEEMQILIQLSLGNGNYRPLPDATTPYPGQLLVDYVGVWQ